jgi:hypothetical protein
MCRGMNLAGTPIFIFIPETEQSFECTSDWTIGDAEVGIRKDHHYRDGSIKLKDTSTGKEICTREAKSFAEVIESVTGEEISNLQFDGAKIISQGREFIFTFVNGEKEFNFMILFCIPHFFL